MSAPKCKICGNHHWSSEPHKFKDDPEPSNDNPLQVWDDRQKEKATQKTETVQSEKGGQESGPTKQSDTQNYDATAAKRSARWKENNPEAYREYMRQYMKEYRRRNK